MINKSYSSLSDSEARAGFSLVNSKGVTFSTLLFQAFNFVVGIAALPLRIFLRSNLGERTIKPGSFLLAIGLHIYYFTIFDGLLFTLGAIPLFKDTSLNEIFIDPNRLLITLFFFLFNPYFIFLLIVIIRGIKHFKQKIREAQENKVGYTFYRGDSRYFKDWLGGNTWGFLIDETVLRTIVEPRAIFKYGIVSFLFSLAIIMLMIFIFEYESGYLLLFFASLGCTGLVLGFDALCLALDEFALFYSKREKALDLLDGKEDMDKLSKQKMSIEEGRVSSKEDEETAQNPQIKAQKDSKGLSIDDEEIFES